MVNIIHVMTAWASHHEICQLLSLSGRLALPLSHLPLFAPDEIRELTFRDERAEVVVKKLPTKGFIVAVRYGRTDYRGRLGSTTRPGTVATFINIETCVMAAIDLSPAQRVFFDLT